MRVLIRYVIRSAGSVERTESVVESELLKIGRATDQAIHVRDKALPLEHSEIRAKGKYLSIKANPGCVLFVNGEQSDQSSLSPGDLIEIGNYRLMIADPYAPYDHVILVEPSQQDEDEVLLSSQIVSRLEDTGLSKRRWSWISVFLILGLCLAVPSAGLFSSDLMASLRQLPAVPSDKQWDSGPLHASHAFIGDDCSRCHVAAFTTVRDEQCVACHTYVEDHVDANIHDISEIKETRCATCHKEHNEPGVLIRRDQALCSNCHVDLTANTNGPTELRNLSDFAVDHPEFKVSTFVPKGAGRETTWSTVRLPLDEAGAVERSNLIFPHDTHLNPEGIESPKGDVVMVCSDCHRPDPSGAYMETVTMEAHCESCHRLTFDPQDPNREVPHGDPNVVVRTLQEYYARLYLLNQVSVDVGAPRRDVRRPGVSSLTPEDRSIVLSWARDRAEQAAKNLFEVQTCGGSKGCHVISIVDDPKQLSRWQVNPVRLTRVWMPKSFFDHNSHRTEECVVCHAAETSEKSDDILLPGVESCRDCHAGEGSDRLLASTCVDCHRFHVPGLEVMKPWVAGSERREELSDLERLKREGL